MSRRRPRSATVRSDPLLLVPHRYRSRGDCSERRYDEPLILDLQVPRQRKAMRQVALHAAPIRAGEPNDKLSAPPHAAAIFSSHSRFSPVTRPVL